MKLVVKNPVWNGSIAFEKFRRQFKQLAEFITVERTWVLNISPIHPAFNFQELNINTPCKCKSEIRISLLAFLLQHFIAVSFNLNMWIKSHGKSYFCIVFTESNIFFLYSNKLINLLTLLSFYADKKPKKILKF